MSTSGTDPSREAAYLAEAQRLTHTGSWAYNHIERKFTYCSDEQFRIYGMHPYRGRPPEVQELLNLIHPEDRERMIELIERASREKSEYTVDYRLLLPHGAVKYVHSTGHPILNDRGELIEHFGTDVDVTERVRVEQRLLAQNEITHVLSEASSLEEAVPKILKAICESLQWHIGVFWRVDHDAGVLRCADLWCSPSGELLEFETQTRASTFPSGSGLAGRVWETAEPLYIVDVAHAADFNRSVAAREGLHGAFAFPIMRRSEVIGVLEFVGRDVWQCEDELLHTMASVGRQIGQFTERAAVLNELQLREAELAHMTRVMTMGELTASIAHEVNQPLGAMVTSAAACARWLAAEPPQMDKARRALERIVNDGRRAGEVIKRIRALMKRHMPRKDSMDINETMSEVIALVQHQLRRNHILLETRFTPELPLIQGDRIQLQQVLLNLIVNAIEAMSGIDEGQRELTIISAAEAPDGVTVEVRDSGTGLDLGRTVHLFEPFYTTKSEGIGIGLSISRSIVEAHGGRLWAAPNSPFGAIFRFSLPVREPVA